MFDKMSQLPDPPDDLPKYLYEGLQKQDPESLESVKEYADALIAYAEAELEAEELADDNEVIQTTKQGPDGWTYLSKRSPCGKNCGGCPHGPYLYRVRREGGSLKWDYIGKTADKLSEIPVSLDVDV